MSTANQRKRFSGDRPIRLLKLARYATLGRCPSVKSVEGLVRCNRQDMRDMDIQE